MKYLRLYHLLCIAMTLFSGIAGAQPVCFRFYPSDAGVGDKITMVGYDEEGELFDLSNLTVFESNFHGIEGSDEKSDERFYSLLKEGGNLINMDIVDGAVVFELTEDMLSEAVTMWDFFCIPGGDAAAFCIVGGTDGVFETVAQAIAAGGTCAGFSRDIPIIIDPNKMKAPEESETLYNGIVLPDQWPPRYEKLTREPMPVPYLKNPPAVIPIDVGRQLFVDDFLIETTTLQHTFHQPEIYREPVIKTEEKSPGMYAAPFSGGVCYDPADNLFKLWYTRVRPHATCYATSKDGIHWEKPELDVESGTNIVLQPKSFNSTTVLLDHNAEDAAERFKYFASEDLHEMSFDVYGWRYTYRSSPDGIHWSEPKAQADLWGDRSTAFYNPFRKVWVISQRTEGRGDDPTSIGRSRSYLEGATARDMVAKVTYNAFEDVQGESVLWTGADKLDPRHTDARFAHVDPQLYTLDAFPYESLMIGQFSIWQGPENDICGEHNIQKRNGILLGFSRDGFHWDRPSRKRFISSTWDRRSWRYGNVQSCAAGCLFVGDKLYFYFSAHPAPRSEDWDTDAVTGLAMLRRDGFASMDASGKAGTLTTRPLTFEGKNLFVNVDCPEGELKVEVLDRDLNVIEPFTLDNCEQVSVDRTLVQVNWEESKDLAALASKPVRFRFHLSNGSLYSFWVSPDDSGASHGYIGAGGPEFTGPTDTAGKAAL